MFSDRLADCADQIEIHLGHKLRSFGDDDVVEGMRYAVAGGKRLRGFLVMETAALHDVGDELSVSVAAAIEAMHAYSLVHDDLPSMDNDDLRRGSPTVHVKWNEATAILVGDALQALSFELLSTAKFDAVINLRLIENLAKVAGAAGMVLGQSQDIAAESATTPLTLDEIVRLQANKTGALITWSAEAGAHLTNADPLPLRQYALALGLAFQIADDILDVDGDPEKAGKRLGKDADAGKATFVSLLGLEGARKRARELVEEAEAALDPYGEKAQTLRQAARFVISRDK